MSGPRLVACDVDGTLLGADGRIGPRTAAVLARMAAAEVPLVLATGRPPGWIRPVCAAIGVAGPTVGANGAVLYDAASDTVLEAVTIDRATLGVVLPELRAAVPGCALAVERVVPGRPESIADPDWPGPPKVEVPSGELDDEPAIKVLARHEQTSSEEMARAARERLGDLVEVTYSTAHGLIECAAAGVTKATGLARLAARLGVEAADVVAFGDMPNDLAMLRWAGLGVAMGNGHPDLRAAADEVTASNLEEGVASVLERWF